MPTKKQRAVFFYISPFCILVDAFAIVVVAKTDRMSMQRSETIRNSSEDSRLIFFI